MPSGAEGLLGGPGLAGWEKGCEFRAGNVDFAVTLGCQGHQSAAAGLTVNTQQLIASIIIICFPRALILEEVVAPLKHTYLIFSRTSGAGEGKQFAPGPAQLSSSSAALLCGHQHFLVQSSVRTSSPDPHSAPTQKVYIATREGGPNGNSQSPCPPLLLPSFPLYRAPEPPGLHWRKESAILWTPTVLTAWSLIRWRQLQSRGLQSHFTLPTSKYSFVE